MPRKTVTVPATEPVHELSDELSGLAEFTDAFPRRVPWPWRWLGIGIVLAALLVGSFELVYWHKVYPGVTADGTDIGSLSQDTAAARVGDHISEFQGQSIAITYGDTTLRIPVNDLKPQYDVTPVVADAYAYGRRGDWWQRAREQLRALLGRATNFSRYTYRDASVTPYINEITDDVASPASDASFTYNGNHAQVTPAVAGQRLNLGQLVLLIQDRLARGDASPVAAPVYPLPAAVSTAALTTAAAQADTYASSPVTLAYNDIVKEVDLATITSWLQVKYHRPGTFAMTHDLADLYPADTTTVSLDLNRTAISSYIAGLAAKIDQEPRNAVLAMQSGQLIVAQASQPGVSLDQVGAVDGVISALRQRTEERTLHLSLKTTQPEVREDNLASLGIKDLISEGETYFPGSPSTRLTNVRAGASKFNNILIKPGDTFSFGALLGDVGPETGYVPELVILGDHEEKQYGGGLCQVSSTAFRAALNAGLPITERVNHAFAISYYTWPYNVPGVDATIYYPSVDFKFKNDTGSYILIQTTMNGVDLKFDFYGSKTKTGVIRGPEFVSGSSDATQPSHTVFYRDVLDLTGKVVKTDKFDTFYESSTKFPVQKQFN